MLSRVRWPVLALATLAAASLACNLSVSGPTPPGPPIPVSTEAAGELKGVWATAIANSAGGQIGITLTQEQLTSFVALKLAGQDNPPLTDPQVYLQGGKILIFGTAHAGSVSTTALATLSLNLSNDGKISFAVDEANFGPLPVPTSLLDKLSSALNEALTGQLGSLASGFKVTDAAIADGQMTLIGTLTR